ncbi:MAG: hypothetical protein ACYTBJ_26105 [Planctomycetota bacterium]|jgi:hypothetical protein
MHTKSRQIVFFGLLLVGAALFAYGLFFHSTSILPKQEKDVMVFARSEMALIREVARSGIVRDETGRIRRTYDKTPPKKCLT